MYNVRSTYSGLEFSPASPSCYKWWKCRWPVHC